MPPGFSGLVPDGLHERPKILSGRIFENNPPIYRWVNVVQGYKAPQGAKESAKAILPSLTGLVYLGIPTPPIKSVGYCHIIPAG